jgi:hypothetical protein
MATTFTSSGPEYVGYAGAEGVVLGNSSSDLIGFYGKAPIAKPSVTQQATATTTALRADIDRVMTALSNLGLVTLT